MGAAQGRGEAAAEAEVEQQHYQNELARQAEQQRAQREIINNQRLERSRRQRDELDRMEKEDERNDQLLREKTEQEKAKRAEDNAREDVLRAENEERLRKTIEDGSAAQDRLRTSNLAEVANRTRNHQDNLIRVAGQVADAEKKGGERIIDLTKEKGAAQEKLHKDIQGFVEKNLQETRDHHARVIAQSEKQAAVLLERDQIAIDHAETTFAMKAVFLAQNQSIQLARQSDRHEINLVDAVNNTRTAGLRLSSQMNNLATLFVIVTQLPAGAEIPQRIYNSSVIAIERSQEQVVVLIENADAILHQRESNNPDTVKCQQISREIQSKGRELQQSLSALYGVMDPAGAVLMKPFLEAMKPQNDELHKLITDLPVVRQTDYVVKEIVNSVNAIVATGTSRRTRRKSPERQEAVEEEPQVDLAD